MVNACGAYHHPILSLQTVPLLLILVALGPRGEL